MTPRAPGGDRDLGDLEPSEAESRRSARERALELLYEAVDKRSNCLIFLRNDPRMRVLREDPHHAGRFEELLNLVGLDDAAVRPYKK